MSIYMGDWTIEEANAVGEVFVGRARGTRTASGLMTEGKLYMIMIEPRILPMSPLCSFIGDDGKMHCMHLERFDKVEKG